MNQLIKKIGPDVVALLFLLCLSLAYFFVPVTQDLVLTGSDNTTGIGLGQEIARHQEKTGEVTRWTNAIFGGMPTYQITPNYGSRTALSWLRTIYELGLSGALMYVFILLTGFYILMRTLRYKAWLSVLGAIAWAFSSYFFIIIGAGHIWKVLTLAFIPPTIAGMILCYRGNYLWGGVLTALFMAFQILSNHLQMTYYFGFVMLFMIVGYLVQAIRQHQMPRFLKATGVFVVANMLALAANLPSLYHTYEYSKESMRGTASVASTATPKKSGLSKDYITQWSYGIGETWTLLVPNVKGGASVPLAYNEKAMEKADPQLSQLYRQIGQYWGDQPGTSGPGYVGAFILLLFFLGIFLVKGPLKWSLLFATVFSILLSWGHNFMGLTDFFIDYVPMYNKFRTVASILVIAEFTIPLLAMMALARIFEEPDLLKKKAWALYSSFGLTGGIALLFALLPTVFFPSYLSQDETTQLARAFGSNPEALNLITNNLSEVRQSIFVADAWRSFWVAAVGFVLLLAYRFNKVKPMPLTLCVILLCLIDLFAINKRYLNDDNFVEEHVNEQSYIKTAADEMILSDQSLDYRVLNLARNTFNENETAYYHKSIGGYHPAKLGRYNDLINYCITPERERIIRTVEAQQGNMMELNYDSICPVLNMLNMKYVIFPVGGGQEVAYLNPAAYGNAWFVQKIQFVKSSNEELQVLKTIDPRTVAVANEEYKDVLAGPLSGSVIDTASVVRLVSYEANELKYEVESPTGGIVVFSEVFYPGWKATLDDQPLSLARANYVLRAAYVPAGHHVIHMEFKPASVSTTETIAYVALALLLVALVYLVIHSIRSKKNNDK